MWGHGVCRAPARNVYVVPFGTNRPVASPSAICLKILTRPCTGLVMLVQPLSLAVTSAKKNLESPGVLGEEAICDIA